MGSRGRRRGLGGQEGVGGAECCPAAVCPTCRVYLCHEVTGQAEAKKTQGHLSRDCCVLLILTELNLGSDLPGSSAGTGPPGAVSGRAAWGFRWGERSGFMALGQAGQWRGGGVGWRERLEEMRGPLCLPCTAQQSTLRPGGARCGPLPAIQPAHAILVPCLPPTPTPYSSGPSSWPFALITISGPVVR